MVKSSYQCVWGANENAREAFSPCQLGEPGLAGGRSPTVTPLAAVSRGLPILAPQTHTGEEKEGTMKSLGPTGTKSLHDHAWDAVCDEPVGQGPAAKGT